MILLTLILFINIPTLTYSEATFRDYIRDNKILCKKYPEYCSDETIQVPSLDGGYTTEVAQVVQFDMVIKDLDESRIWFWGLLGICLIAGFIAFVYCYRNKVAAVEGNNYNGDGNAMANVQGNSMANCQGNPMAPVGRDNTAVGRDNSNLQPNDVGNVS